MRMFMLWRCVGGHIRPVTRLGRNNFMASLAVRSSVLFLWRRGAEAPVLPKHVEAGVEPVESTKIEYDNMLVAGG